MLWTVGQGDNGVIIIWGCSMVIYESGYNLEPLKQLYREKIMSLKLKAIRLLVGFVGPFQGFVIFHQ